jgi:hypothetical protein
MTDKPQTPDLTITQSGVAVQHRDADLDFRDLPLEVPRHQRLAE